MKWTVKLVAEGRSSVEHEVIAIERGESISPGTIGLTIAEGKLILEGLQRHVVASQVQEHNVAQRPCSQCGGKAFRSKGYYRSTLRSVYGNVAASLRHPTTLHALQTLRSCTRHRQGTGGPSVGNKVRKIAEGGVNRYLRSETTATPAALGDHPLEERD